MHSFIRMSMLVVLMVAPALSLAAEKHLYARRVGEIFEDRQVRKLARAAATGDTREIEQLVNQQGVAADAPGYLGVPPLWWAAQRQNIKGFRKLLELGADPNYQWETGDSVMNHVVRMKSPEFLRAALEHGGNPNLVKRLRADASETPIFRGLWSPESDNSETLKLLISAGANVNYNNGVQGATPCSVAATLRMFSVLTAMLEAGCDFNVKTARGIYAVLDILQAGIEHDRNLTAAKEKERQQVIDFLVSKGVKLSDYSRSITYPQLGIPYP